MNEHTDTTALDAIAVIMSGTEWSADTLDAIAEVLHDAGRPLAEPGA
jgi:hypothetical protein